MYNELIKINEDFKYKNNYCLGISDHNMLARFEKIYIFSETC